MFYNLAYEDISNATPPQLTNNNNSPQCTHPIPTNASLQVLNGPKVFCDASVCMQTPPRQHRTGVGIFILTDSANFLCSGSFFQVATQEYMDPIEAEAQALLQGAKLARALNL
jgi:hypothetical protein